MEVVVAAVHAAKHKAQHVVGPVEIDEQRIIREAVGILARRNLPLLKRYLVCS